MFEDARTGVLEAAASVLGLDPQNHVQVTVGILRSARVLDPSLEVDQAVDALVGGVGRTDPA